MAFRNNDAVVTSAMLITVDANRANDTYFADGPTAFVFQNGPTGDDIFLNFDFDDVILTARSIFDDDNNGFISGGPNNVIDIDRTSPGNAGEDQIQIAWSSNSLNELRTLGSKLGQFAYADSLTLKNLWSQFGQENVIEGTIANNRLTAQDGAKVILHDNALGLNLGSDTICGFGDDDLLITTRQLFDGNGDGVISFGRNHVLDASGATGPNSTDPSKGLGGQLKFVDADLQSLDYLGSQEINGITYYYYGTNGSDYVPGSDLA
ncbi:hypothetical protein [Sphingomonas lacusdianchii]|uniref:hypothetical protein n=1 Tax=Sphingomonas lacusdianchii TaxID=2917992 RepID=UPI001F594765|nr:hypothetical protein [Sphingomonas sp. JXJ CY 53]